MTAGLWILLIAALIVLGRRRAAIDVARFVPDCIVLFKRMLGDPRVPRRVKLVLALLIPYLAMPFDLVPDFIPIVGYLDDALLVALAVGYAMRCASQDVIRELWPGSERNLRIVLTFQPGLDQRVVGGGQPPV
ncbi:MAG: hypothetical protein QOE13_1679 [Gaiellaceae bacterium]|nr:hypothetical protein [Gaiellaceae bacterium]